MSELTKACESVDFWKEKLLESKDNTLGMQSFAKAQLKDAIKKMEELCIAP